MKNQFTLLLSLLLAFISSASYAQSTDSSQAKPSRFFLRTEGMGVKFADESVWGYGMASSLGYDLSPRFTVLLGASLSTATDVVTLVDKEFTTVYSYNGVDFIGLYHIKNEERYRLSVGLASGYKKWKGQSYTYEERRFDNFFTGETVIQEITSVSENSFKTAELALVGNLDVHLTTRLMLNANCTYSGHYVHFFKIGAACRF